MLDWDPADRAKLLAYLLESADRCSGCGTAGWEWDADRHAYEAAVHQCWGCYVKEFSREDTEGMLGARIVLLPKLAAQAARESPRRRPGLS